MPKRPAATPHPLSQRQLLADAGRITAALALRMYDEAPDYSSMDDLLAAAEREIAAVRRDIAFRRNGLGRLADERGTAAQLSLAARCVVRALSQVVTHHFDYRAPAKATEPA